MFRLAIVALLSFGIQSAASEHDPYSEPNYSDPNLGIGFVGSGLVWVGPGSDWLDPGNEVTLQADFRKPVHRLSLSFELFEPATSPEVLIDLSNADPGIGIVLIDAYPWKPQIPRFIIDATFFPGFEPYGVVDLLRFETEYPGFNFLINIEGQFADGTPLRFNHFAFPEPGSMTHLALLFTCVTYIRRKR